MHVIPPTYHPNKATPPLSAPSAPGVHDTLRANLGLVLPNTSESKASASSVAIDPSQTANALQSAHPLEGRLRAWEGNAENLRMQTWRHANGIALPAWKGVHMEAIKIGEWQPALLGGSSSSTSDVLAGKDTEITWEDVYSGMLFHLSNNNNS
jgi:proteasome maturation protein